MPYKNREQQLKYFRRRRFACKDELESARRRKYIEKHPVQTIVAHHTRYKEIHGVDKTVLMTASEHKRLHNRLRRDGRCNVPSDILARISAKAHRRTERRKVYLKSDRIKRWNREYHSKSYDSFFFTEVVDTNIQLVETIQMNNSTETITVSSFFRGNGDRDIIKVDI